MLLMSVRSSAGCGGLKRGSGCAFHGHDRQGQARPVASQFERGGHRIGRGQDHRPQRVRNRQPDAMAFGENPRSQVHHDIERIDFAGFEGARLRHGFALRAVDARARDLGDGSVGSYVREPREPVRQWRRGRGLQQGPRPSQDRQVFLERRGIVYQAEGVHGTRIAQQLSPPESGFHADRRNVFELMHVRLGCGLRQSMVRLRERRLFRAHRAAASCLRAAIHREHSADSDLADASAAYK